MASSCASFPGSAAKGGKIVLVSSARGLLGHPAGYTAYCASKAAVDVIAGALGYVLGPTGISVNAIAPTVFRSPLTAWMFEDTDNAKAVRDGFLTRVPKGRLGKPVAEGRGSLHGRIRDSLTLMGLDGEVDATLAHVSLAETVPLAVADADVGFQAALIRETAVLRDRCLRRCTATLRHGDDGI